MTWLNQHRRTWRIIILVLLVLSFIGPWGYDLINVPAQYECTPPNFRLEGDFCGIPLPGVWAVLVSFSVIFEVFAGETNTTFAVLLMRVLFSFSVLLTPLPIFSSLFLLSSGGHSWPQTRHIIALGVAAVGGLMFVLSSVSLQGHLSFYLWGAWAYVVLAFAALLLEIGVLISNREPGLSEMGGG
jgi:hypothetical protein